MRIHYMQCVFRYAFEIMECEVRKSMIMSPPVCLKNAVLSASGHACQLVCMRRAPRVKRTFKKGEEEEPDEKDVAFARKMMDEWLDGATDAFDELMQDGKDRAAELLGKRTKKKGDRDVQKALTVAIVGPPNAGKSVLLNALVGEHVSHQPSLEASIRHRITSFHVFGCQ